jgi:flagellar protein FliS
VAYPRSANVAAYQSAVSHGGVAASDPHGLVLLLMNGALERIAKARGCIANNAYAEKAQLIHRSVQIIDQLRNSLNLQAGGSVAENLDKLYEYMGRRLLNGSVENSLPALDEVNKLLSGIRDSWAQIPKAAQMGSHK